MGKRRKNVEKRLSLVRACGTCGKLFSTSAESPWIRQIPRDGKKMATTYYCSTQCYAASYKHIGWYDGKAEIRREEREKSRVRDYAAYRAAHKDEINEKRRERYWKNRDEEIASMAYQRKKRRLLSCGGTA